MPSAAQPGWYEDLRLHLDDDPGEFYDRSEDPAAQGILRGLRAILNS